MMKIRVIIVQYHEVRLQFEFEDVNKLIVWCGDVAPTSSAFSFKEASVLCDYVYLDSEERRRFAQVGHEYLIEQVQHTGVATLPGTSSSSNISYKYQMNFNHPCKEIIWAMKNGAWNGEATKNNSTTKSRFLTYTHDDSKWTTDALDLAALNLATNMISLTVPTDAQVTYEVVSLAVGATTTHVVTASGFDLTINFTHATLSVTTEEVYVITNAFTCGTHNLTQGLHEFNVDLTVVSNNVTAVAGVTVVSHSLDLNDVSIPVEDWVDYRVLTDASGVNPKDCTVVLPSNYGVRLDGRGNPVSTANIQLNGHDRFEYLEGSYFNYVQPFQHHTRTPADGVNVYSFALHPEQHQPSGSANLSRIDKADLNLNISDPFRARGTTSCRLNLTRDTLLYCYAVNYNILRVMSGMGGLAYSN